MPEVSPPSSRDISIIRSAASADTAYGTAEMLDWLVHEQGIEPHLPVFDKSRRDDGTFSRSDFTFDHQAERLELGQFAQALGCGGESGLSSI